MNNIEEQYGLLNINAQTYVPKKKKIRDNNMNNNNYESNNINNIPSGNYISQYY